MVFLFVFANQNSRPSSPFGFVGDVPIRSGLSTFNRVSFLFPSSPHLCALCVRRLPRPGRGGENFSSFRSSPIRPSSLRLCVLCALCVENSSSFCPSEPLRAVDSSRFELTLDFQS